MRVETSIKTIQIRIYDKHPDKYICACIIHLEGEKGIIESLIGRGFYDNARDILALLRLEYGVIELSGTVMPAHARAIERYLGRDFDIKCEGIKAHGRRMIYITVTPKSCSASK